MDLDELIAALTRLKENPKCNGGEVYARQNDVARHFNLIEVSVDDEGDPIIELASC